MQPYLTDTDKFFIDILQYESQIKVVFLDYQWAMINLVSGEASKWDPELTNL